MKHLLLFGTMFVMGCGARVAGGGIDDDAFPYSPPSSPAPPLFGSSGGDDEEPGPALPPATPYSSGTLVTTLGPTYAMTGDATDLYVGLQDDGRIARIPKSGGSATILDGVAGVMPAVMVADDTYLWFVEPGDPYGNVSGRVGRIPKAGGTVDIMYTSEISPVAIAVDDDAVYFVEQGYYGGGPTVLGAVRRFSKAASPGDPIDTLVPYQRNALDLVIAGDEIVFTSFGTSDKTPSIFAVAKTGGEPRVVAAALADAPFRLVVAGDRTWFIGTDSKGGQHLESAPLAGGSATRVVDAAFPNAVLASNGDSVFYSASDGQQGIEVVDLDAATGTSAVVATLLDTFPPGETGYATTVADANDVFWIRPGYSYTTFFVESAPHP